MPPKPETWSFSYRDLSEFLGMSQNSLQAHRMRGNLDPTSLRSIVLFAARHAPSELRYELVMRALGSQEETKPKRPKRGKK